MNDVYNDTNHQDQDDSHPASGESSARQTPQPSLPNTNKEVQATFAKQVAALAIDKDEIPIADEAPALEPPPVLDHHLGHHPVYSMPPPQQPAQPVLHQRLDTVVQTSKLQVTVVKFILFYRLQIQLQTFFFF